MNKGILLSIFNNKQIFEKPVVFATNLLFLLRLITLRFSLNFIRRLTSEIQATYVRFCYPDPLVRGQRSAHPLTTPTSANASDSERA